MLNQSASVASLAKATLLNLDRSKEFTSLPTQTLELLLNTLIELGYRDNPTAQKIENANAAFVTSRISGLEGH
jgi:hypothetical protein